MARINFMNIEVDNLTMSEALQSIDSLIVKNKVGYVVTPNVDHIVQLQKDKALNVVYENADLIITDGKPLIWISKLYRTPIKERISGADLFPKLCALAAQKGYSMFFLGAAKGVAVKAAEKLKNRYPGLNVVGTFSPPRGFETDETELRKINEMITKVKPHILIVGLGCPKQEKFIYKHRNELNVPVSLALGASLDFEAGTVKRAPRWISRYGLEWFYRLCQEPKRLFKRYLINDISIIPLIFKYWKS